MKNIQNQLLALFALLLVPVVSANAQKLPSTQKQSIHAPANVKIDGKATEWGDKLQAYNHATQIFYTVANDDKKIYLVVKADKRQIINKIINGGISFTVITNGKKDKEKGPTITFPVFTKLNHPSVNIEAMTEIKAGEPGAEKTKDSLLAISNASLEEKAKFIRVNGIPDVDSLISIYNTDGIKARSALDDKLNYVIELSINLTLLNLTSADLKTFNYNITLNGIEVDYIPGIDIAHDEAGNEIGTTITSSIASKYSGSTIPTDCWGIYTLAK